MHAQSCPTLWDPMDCSPPAALSMGCPKQESWSMLPFPTPRNLPDPGIKTVSFEFYALAGRFFTTLPPRKPIKPYMYS